jgi:hypothetical protein
MLELDPGGRHDGAAEPHDRVVPRSASFRSSSSKSSDGPTPVRAFLVVEVDNGVSLDYHDTDGDVRRSTTFLVSEADFDAISTVVERARLLGRPGPHGSPASDQIITPRR